MRLNVFRAQMALRSSVLAPKCLRPDVSRPNVGFRIAFSQWKDKNSNYNKTYSAWIFIHLHLEVVTVTLEYAWSCTHCSRQAKSEQSF